MSESSSSIEVLKPGAYTTVQDLGCTGYQHLGVPVSGAMDEVALRLANSLAGNSAHAAALEATLMGPALRFSADTVIACCGADLSASVDGMAVPLATAFPIKAGAILQFGRKVSGVRSYLAVQGGFSVPDVMGSSSTYARAGFGGFGGRALRKGDVLHFKSAVPSIPERSQAALSAEAALLAAMVSQGPIRVVAGPEWDEFTPAAREQWLGQAWRISAQSDRMGYRFEGAVLARNTQSSILSEPVTFGTVQVPPDGQPIVLMAERQTTGGYPRIANVIAADLFRLAQCAPGDHVRFVLVDMDTAQQLLIERANLFKALEASFP